MNKIITFLIFACTISITAQNSYRINYQTVIRDADNIVVGNTNVGVQINILQTSASGTSVYSENQNVTTNINGLANLVIGNAAGFDSIDWSAGPYFINVEIDPTGGTSYTLSIVNQLLSVPYALHSASADVAATADYNSLTNLPTIITSEQAAKVDFITVTSAVNLDQLQTDVTANNAKVTFPGFGTVPGTALEGDNVIWTKSVTDDIFYNAGNVGVGVDESSSFSGSKLHVGGPILFDGTPAGTVPGSLYYDNTGNGSFHYIDNTNTDVTINTGAVTYTGGLWSIENGDATISTDVIIQNSLGVGVDATSGVDFGFNTLLLTENNLRILFDDSDDISGTLPANDWQIEINESSNGGTNHFAIVDVTGATTPFKIMAGAAEHSLFVAANGNVGIGTNLPTNKLEIVGAIKADSFVGDGSGITGIASGTGGITNAGDTTIAADNDADTVGEIAFQTQNTTRMTISNTGFIGIGTTTPSVALEVVGDAKVDNMTLNGNVSVQGIAITPNAEISATTFPTTYDVTDKSFVTFDGQAASSIQAFSGGITGQSVIVAVLTSDVTFEHNAGTISQNFQLAGNANILLTANSSATFIYDGTNWYCVGLNN
ncbi:hypothetical protein D1815_00360 [Aquimarina sp. AD1]|uniref:hypothetical protein n=1 Tax=Aquimarina sp. (strain AD1) TaxID=1714848 RepID=UPI000E49AF5D|nr:hypothetical protein [Aquimarina sp. AD1]AXT54263.1 hypothetical protein D1815_00360 [Aquimarina sp. AD1]RKN16820.1 hypothetical protein D7035_15295 [Aquimarina sp. AD1]